MAMFVNRGNAQRGMVPTKFEIFDVKLQLWLPVVVLAHK
jgi:hypothetical protein